ncbi:hypothetical protein [Marinobacterium lutimaris]|uniref:Uncharacterized protein n=1 Tax=Marinobacterium lutimaris TaxID=568106 RepID=A0A1H6DUK4_9GAMM|nr:hypothetical protein [Marinobacterium lutimaris]SEG88971.1 hypothetical protein SAMN05444390_11069 [Marinobacterium lutimaris]
MTPKLRSAGTGVPNRTKQASAFRPPLPEDEYAHLRPGKSITAAGY